MPLSKSRALSHMLFAAALLVTSAPFATTADKPKTDSDIPPRIDARVEAWQPVASERRLDEVGWAADIRKAQSLAKENNRPVFLFTYNGCSDRENALCLQRC